MKIPVYIFLSSFSKSNLFKLLRNTKIYVTAVRQGLIGNIGIVCPCMDGCSRKQFFQSVWNKVVVPEAFY